MVLWPLLLAAQEEDMASLEVAGLVEKSDERAGDGGREAAVLGNGFDGDEDEAGVCLPGGAVLGIEGHEVLDVGCDQGDTSGCRCVSLPGEKVAFAPPGVFGRCLSVAGGGDLRVDLVWVRRPVSDGDADKTRWRACVVFDQGDQGILSQLGLCAAGRSDRTDHLWSVPAFMDTELGCQLTELPIS
jgi:hypothetical protein